MKRFLCILLGLCLLFCLAGCGDDGTGVYVQSVRILSAQGGIGGADRFAGIVVSEHVSEIQRDPDKTIEELFVREGDDVAAGQALFAYDTEQLQLTLDKQKLELEQLLMTIESYKNQIAELEADRNKADSATKLQYTIEIQSLQVDLKEAELNVTAKEAAVAKSEEILANTTVLAPVAGRIQSISESGTDNYGNTLPYITIQQSGSYRIKGTIGELQRGSLTEGARIRIFSRTDSSVFWSGVVTLVDYESPYQGNSYDMYYGSSPDEMTSASKYPFYVELDSTDGLILGQHVYMEQETQQAPRAEVCISGAFICYDEAGLPYVWAERKGALEMRSVTLGEYDGMTDTYEVLSGLELEDYIAFPDELLCHPGAPTTRSAPAAQENEVG